MTQDEIILAQQARIEQLREVIKLYDQAVMESWPKGAMGDAFDYWNAARAAISSDDLSALRAHDAAILREAAEYCKQQADEWARARVLTFENYAGNCADELNTRAKAIEKGGV